MYPRSRGVYPRRLCRREGTQHARRHVPFGGSGPPVPIIATGAFVATLGVLHSHGADRRLDALGVVLAAIACYSLLGWRREPLAVFVLSAAAGAAISLLGYRLGPPIAPTIAVMFVAASRRTRGRLPLTGGVLFGMLAVVIGAAVLGQHRFPGAAILGTVALWGGAWIVGEQIRQRRQRMSDYRERAASSARLAVAEERTRIARDLHDSAAHAINVILVQAGAARLLQDKDPGAVQKALETIEDVARETIGDIDRLVGGLRERSGVVEPPLGIAAVATLAERQRATVRVHGTARQLAPGLDQAAYRIVQESLTNAARYGEGGAEVDIDYRGDVLELTVTNQVAAGRPNGGSGHGILGMRERAELLGGTLSAGPADGRFVVRARLRY